MPSSSDSLSSPWRGRGAVLVALYLAAAVGANLLIARLGQRGLVITALVLIPFDLVARDVLHARWEGRALVGRMAALVLGGSILSYLVNPASARVALASCMAFAAAGATDAIVFQALRQRRALVRINGSNAVSAVVDSLIFPLVAFGGGSASLSIAQACVKFAGGLAWSILLVRFLNRRTR